VRELLEGVDLEGVRLAADAEPRRVGSTPRAFVSYSHKDESLRAELDTHLKLLGRRGLLEIWTDQRIGAGEEWKGQIDKNLERADLVLLLVSPAFFESDYCYDLEMQLAMERHEEGSARVIPILVRPISNWQAAPFGKLQALPAGGKPVTTWSGGRTGRDKAWANVAEGIEAALRELAARPR
jgi:internalin A